MSEVSEYLVHVLCNMYTERPNQGYASFPLRTLTSISGKFITPIEYDINKNCIDLRNILNERSVTFIILRFTYETLSPDSKTNKKHSQQQNEDRD